MSTEETPQPVEPAAPPKTSQHLPEERSDAPVAAPTGGGSWLVWSGAKPRRPGPTPSSR
jgi:hypothetical protein